MNITLIHAARRSRIVVVAALAVAATTATLLLDQGGVTGAEQDSSSFTVAGDGDLRTTKPSLGDSREPLSTDETSYAIHVASTDASIPPDATDVRGEDGPEFLYADVPDADVDAGGRTAVVTLYDYTGNQAYTQLVDLATGRVVRSQAGRRLQPPASPDESKAAMTLAIDAAAPAAFAAQFEQLEGVPLVSPEQVHYVAGAWVHDATTTGGDECGDHRCLELMVSTPAGIYLDTTDVVVDLSTRTVIDLEQP